MLLKKAFSLPAVSSAFECLASVASTRCLSDSRRLSSSFRLRPHIFLRNYSRIGVFTFSFAVKCCGDGERQRQTQKRIVWSRSRRDWYAKVHGTSFGGGGIRHVHNGRLRRKRHQHAPSPRQAASQAAPSPGQISLSASARYPSSLCVSWRVTALSPWTAFPARPRRSRVVHLTLPAVTI
jgi:hypothetical protein